MNVTYTHRNNVDILLLEATNDSEDEEIEEFARPNEPFTGEIKEKGRYKHLHIILRKET